MEDNNRKSTTLKQIEVLIEFLENHTDLAVGQHRTREARAIIDSLWAKCAQSLNQHGPPRKPKEWRQYWNETKSKMRSKIRQVNNLDLSPLEARISCLVGPDAESANKSDSIFDEKFEPVEEVDASFFSDPDPVTVTSRKKKIRQHSSDDDIPLKRKMEPIEGLEKACKFLNQLQDLDVNSLINDMDEFQYFGLNIAAQLRKLPLERALRIQLDIQNMITNERIEHLNESKNNINALPEQNMNPGI